MSMIENLNGIKEYGIRYFIKRKKKNGPAQIAEV